MSNMPNLPNTKFFSKSKQFLLIAFYLFFSLLITQINSENAKKPDFTQEEMPRHNLTIASKEDLRSFVELLLGEEMMKNYTQLSRAEKLYYDIFIQRMVDSYNHTDFSPESITSHLTPENIEREKELAFEEFSLNYYKIEDELKQEIKKNEPEPSDFYDDNLDNDDDENNQETNKDGQEKVNAKGFDDKKEKNEL